MMIQRATLETCGEATGTVVVIDVLRAFTTAAYAFATGAADITLVGEIEEAFTLRDQSNSPPNPNAPPRKGASQNLGKHRGGRGESTPIPPLSVLKSGTDPPRNRILTNTKTCDTI